MLLHNSASACPARLFCVANKAWLLFPEIQTDHNYVLQNYCNTDFKLKSAMRFCGALAQYEFFWPHSWASIIKRQTLGKLCIPFWALSWTFSKGYHESVFTQLWVVFSMIREPNLLFKGKWRQRENQIWSPYQKNFAILWRRTFFAILGDFFINFTMNQRSLIKNTIDYNSI